MILLQIAVIFAAGVTLFYCLGCIARMDAKTHHGIRAAYILIAVGAFGEVAAVLDGHVPGIAETLFMSGCGALDFLDRRTSIRRSLQQGDCHVEK